MVRIECQSLWRRGNEERDIHLSYLSTACLHAFSDRYSPAKYVHKLNRIRWNTAMWVLRVLLSIQNKILLLLLVLLCSVAY